MDRTIILTCNDVFFHHIHRTYQVTLVHCQRRQNSLCTVQIFIATQHFRNLPDRLWGPPSFLSSWFLGLFPREQSVKLTIHRHLVPRSRMVELYLQFLIRLHGVELNQLSTCINLLFFALLYTEISVLASLEVCAVAMFVVLTTGTETKLYQGSKFRAFRMAHVRIDRAITIGNIGRLWNGKSTKERFEKPINECVFVSVSILFQFRIKSYRPAIPKFGQRGHMRPPTIFTVNNK
jgi:hypothetical protein